MGRRRRKGKLAEELTLEGFGALEVQPDPPEAPHDRVGEASAHKVPHDPPAAEAPGEAGEVSLPDAPGEPPPGEGSHPPEPAQEAAEPQQGEPEEGASDASLSAPPGEPQLEEDLPPEARVLQRSFPPQGGIDAGSHGPDLAGSGDSQGESPPPAPAEASPLPDSAGPTSEMPVQEARAVPVPPSSDEPSPELERDEELFSDLEEARALQREGRAHAAMDLLRAMVESDPRNVEARVELGVLLDRTGAHAAAVEHLEAAHRAVPDSVQILSALGAALTSLGRFEEAERELKRAQRLAPEDLLVRANLAIVSFRRGLYGHAESELRWICDRDEGNATAHFYRGEALNRLGRVDEALDAMKTVTRLDPGNSRAFYTMGILYDKKHLPTEAAAMYRKAREVGPR